VGDVWWPSPKVCCHALEGVLESGKYGLQIDQPLVEYYVKSFDFDCNVLFKSQAVKDGLLSSPM
jgi:hypothetical protein